MTRVDHKSEHHGEQGFMLLAAIFAVFLVLLALGIAAPKVAQDLRREREVEAIQRGNQYVRAIRLYYKKFGRYPASMDALEKSNNVRFLRRKYVDPITGNEDWRLIHFGEAKTTVKGFFGQPLAGIQGSPGGLGSAAGMSSNIGGGSSTPGAASSSPLGSSSPGASGTNSPGGSSQPYTLGGVSSSTPGSSTPGSTGATGTAPGNSSDSGTSSMGGISSQSASAFSGTGQPFVGIGIPKEGDSITVLNEQTTYQTWEFIYDPRIEQMYAKAALLGGSPANNSGTLGTSPNQLGSPLGNTPLGTNPTNPTTPTTPSSPSTGTPTGNPNPQ